ncbi:MAG TPA: hypothetical protein VGQ08_01710 [Nitrospiraceae bacterium]|jgi:hypothetical protein|nr:hypothetical protein [Nitrospiraceae bacterium]
MKDSLSSRPAPFKMAVLRAYGQEPVLRYVAKRSNGGIMVVSESGYQSWRAGRGIPRWIGWPKKDIFDYDEAVFRRLHNLYQSGNTNELFEAWGKLRPLT